MNKYTYPKGFWHIDFEYDIATSLFLARKKKKISLDEAAQKSGVSINDIADLEGCCANLDFIKIIKLLKLYNDKLRVSSNGLNKLPLCWRQKYFDKAYLLPDEK